MSENTIVMGQVLLFDGENVVNMHNSEVSTIEVLHKGDKLAADDESIVSYTSIDGIDVGKKKQSIIQPPSAM